MAFTVDDLRQLSDLTVSSWRDGIDRDWPMWASPGWSSPTDDPDAWRDLLRSSGR